MSDAPSESRGEPAATTGRQWWSTEHSAEQALIAYLESPGDSASALRALADRLDADDDLCLIGLWVCEEPVEYVAGTRLQVALTRLEPS